jgi:hypothetical protein
MTFCRSFNACVEIEAVFGHGVTCPLLRSSGPVVSCRRGSGFTPHSEELSEARLIEEPLIFRRARLGLHRFSGTAPGSAWSGARSSALAGAASRNCLWNGGGGRANQRPQPGCQPVLL